jgi:hypothetical protein
MGIVSDGHPPYVDATVKPAGGLPRRTLLAGMPLALAAAASASSASANPSEGPALRIGRNGRFKILALSDFHYVPEPDRHGLALAEKLVAAEKPDLVIVDGDNISGGDCKTAAEVSRAVANVAMAMENAKVPWAAVLGNHDQEYAEQIGISRGQLFDIYESHPHNLNRGWMRGLHGAGNMNLLIWDASRTRPLFCLWLLDSGGSVTDRDIRYDWIHSDQVAWYMQTSKALESRFGSKIPGLMFFHIPLPEFREMILTRKVLGERHEPESPSSVNGGLFAAVLERGDVMGIFCGHDHVNNYVGLYRGIALGYVGVAGYRGYPHTPPEDVTNDRARGGRVLLLDQTQSGKFKTWMHFRDGTTNWEHWSDAYETAEIK